VKMRLFHASQSLTNPWPASEIRMAIGKEERRNKMLIETRLHTYVLNGTEPTELEEAANAWDFLKDDC
jgi:hypothetical protein